MIKTREHGVAKIIDIPLVLPHISQTRELLYKNPNLSNNVQAFLNRLSFDPSKLDRMFAWGTSEEDYLVRATRTDQQTPLYQRIVIDKQLVNVAMRSDSFYESYTKIGNLDADASKALINIWKKKYGIQVVDAVLKDSYKLIEKINGEILW